jgi:DNA-binding ferritin-like protein
MTSTIHSTHLPPLHEPHARDEVGQQLQATLVDLVDLSLLGKQLHWTVVGPLFRSLYVQPDELIDSWRELADTVAERARERMDRLGELDVVTQDVPIEVVRALEQQLWMIRAQRPDGGDR